MAEWITKEAACEAVRRVRVPTESFALPETTTRRTQEAAIAAIRALPSPAPVGEDGSVEEIVKARIRRSEDDAASHGFKLSPPSDLDVALWRQEARWYVLVINAHRRREADEVREVLRVFLAAAKRYAAECGGADHHRDDCSKDGNCVYCRFDMEATKAQSAISTTTTHAAKVKKVK